MIKSRLNFLINLRTGLRTFELQNSQKLRNLSLTQILGVLIKKKRVPEETKKQQSAQIR